MTPKPPTKKPSKKRPINWDAIPWEDWKGHHHALALHLGFSRQYVTRMAHEAHLRKLGEAPEKGKQGRPRKPGPLLTLDATQLPEGTTIPILITKLTNVVNFYTDTEMVLKDGKATWTTNPAAE